MTTQISPESAALLAAMYEKSEQDRAAVMSASVGDQVCTPRGGEPGIVAAILPDGGRLVTSDGDPIQRTHCKDDDPSDLHGYFEYVGGRASGYHGWYHVQCRRITQVG